MTGQYGMVCTTHEPPLYAATVEVRDRSLHELLMIYGGSSALFELNDDLWPDEYRRDLYWLRHHRNCRVAFEPEGPAGAGELVWPEDASTVPQQQAEAPGARPGPPPDLERRRGIAWLTDEDMMHLFSVPAAEGYRFRGLVTAPERFAVGVLVVHPDLDLIEPGCEAQWIPGAMRAATEYRVIDGEVWRRSRLTVEQLGGRVVTIMDGAGNPIADWRVPGGP